MQKDVWYRELEVLWSPLGDGVLMEILIYFVANPEHRLP
jgi:hypothetical protein